MTATPETPAPPDATECASSLHLALLARGFDVPVSLAEEEGREVVFCGPLRPEVAAYLALLLEPPAPATTFGDPWEEAERAAGLLRRALWLAGVETEVTRAGSRVETPGVRVEALGAHEALRLASVVSRGAQARQRDVAAQHVGAPGAGGAWWWTWCGTKWRSSRGRWAGSGGCGRCGAGASGAWRRGTCGRRVRRSGCGAGRRGRTRGAGGTGCEGGGGRSVRSLRGVGGAGAESAGGLRPQRGDGLPRPAGPPPSGDPRNPAAEAVRTGSGPPHSRPRYPTRRRSPSSAASSEPIPELRAAQRPGLRKAARTAGGGAT
ncbi:hypothetical protein GA0115246_110332 [Streptomyces sp. SolWspMP-sol7th]|nr:hypothetical protein GA0115246_110332 [Streptomyces sp. SolWspMP-sol7th]